MELELPYRISKACIRLPSSMRPVQRFNMINIMTKEMQAKIFNLSKGDMLSIKNLGTLEVEHIDIQRDHMEEKRFDYDFRFRQFIFTCKTI